MQNCQSGKSKSIEKEEQVHVLPVTTIDTATAITVKDYLGSIEGKINVEIRPQVEGILEKIYVDEGDYVEKGQLLFKINEQPYREELNNALANQRVEEAKLKNAALEVERLQPLVDNEVISEVKIKTAQSEYEVAKASLAKAQAAVGSARINQGFTLIKASVSGYIGRIPKRIGNLVSKGDQEPMTVLSDVHEVYVYFAMSESDFLYFNERAKEDTSDLRQAGKDVKKLIPQVSLVLADGSEYPEQGVIDAVDGQVSRTTGSISLRATFPNTDNILRSGNTGKIEVKESHHGVILVPQEATTELMDKVFVFVLKEGNVVKKQAITIGGKSGNNYIVKEGLAPGDKIVTAGLNNIDDGSRVSPSS